VLFLGVADNQILSPLLPAIRAQFGKSSSEMGYLFSGYSFCAGFSVLVWGPLSDAFGRKRGLLHGLAIFAAGSCLAFLSTNFLALLAGRIIAGIGASMLSLNSIAYAADFFPYENRGWAIEASVVYFALIWAYLLAHGWRCLRMGSRFRRHRRIALLLLVLCYCLLKNCLQDG
jgi:MFS family permease